MFGRPVSPKPKVTIRYTSPERQRLSEYYRKPPKPELKRPLSPYEKTPLLIPQTHISSSNVVMEMK